MLTRHCLLPSKCQLWPERAFAGGSTRFLVLMNHLKSMGSAAGKDGYPVTPSSHSHTVILPWNCLWLPIGGEGKWAALSFLHKHSRHSLPKDMSWRCPPQRHILERVGSLPLSDFHLLGLTLWEGTVLVCPHGADLRSGDGLILFWALVAGVFVALTLLLWIWGGALLRAGVIAGCGLVPAGRTGRGRDACLVSFSSRQYLLAPEHGKMSCRHYLRDLFYSLNSVLLANDTVSVLCTQCVMEKQPLLNVSLNILSDLALFPKWNYIVQCELCCLTRQIQAGKLTNLL